MFGFHTIPEGQRVAVWNHRGELRIVDGPRRLFTFREHVDWLNSYSAGPDEYLVIVNKDGRVVHKRGPAFLWWDPVRHASIDVEKAEPVDSHESIVVYRRDGENVMRRVEQGPKLFVPTAEEWLHRFSWHGADPKNPTRKIPSALKFTRLRVIPDQMYFDVEQARTADDALLKVMLMIFFELTDVETMLDMTHDPIADFVNAVTADVIDFVGRCSFEEFKERCEALNDLATYPQLTTNSKRIGYTIHKVVYRGYMANKSLQDMHDAAIEARTQLKLKSETEEQAQEIEDLKLERETERTEKRHTMEKANIDHENRMKDLKHAQALRELKQDAEMELENESRHNDLRLSYQKASSEEQARFLLQIADMKVDLTRYLVAQYRNPDRLIQVGGVQKEDPQIHLHES